MSQSIGDPPPGGTTVGQHGPTNIVPPPTVGQHGPTVVNQELLVLPTSLFDELSARQRHDVNIVQLQFARDVSAAAAAAYERIIAALNDADTAPSPNGNKPVVNEAG
jgi:hypothetical protein